MSAVINELRDQIKLLEKRIIKLEKANEPGIDKAQNKYKDPKTAGAEKVEKQNKGLGERSTGDKRDIKNL